MGIPQFRPWNFGLEEHMQARTERPNCRDLAERLGLIGSAKGLPRDLASRALARLGGTE